MSTSYDVDVRYAAACTFRKFTKNLKCIGGIRCSKGVSWLTKVLNCDWLIHDIVKYSVLMRQQEAYIEIKFTTRQVKRNGFDNHQGRLIFSDGSPLIYKSKKYDACDLIVIDTKKCPLLFLLVYSKQYKQHVLMLSSEYKSSK